MTSGQLLLLDIFSYSCMNCLRSLRYIKKINEKYEKYGLGTMLVHPPEWGFEKNSNNINYALKKQKINFPLINDKNKRMIKKFKVNFWPAQILIRNSKVLYKHIGEGDYKKLEDKIIKILEIKSKRIFNKEPVYSKFPTIYFGRRKKGKLINNKSKLRFGLVYAEGKWTQNNEYLKNKGKKSSLTTLTKGRRAYLVAKATTRKSAKIIVKIDDKTAKRLAINKPNLYLIARLNDAKPHKLSLIIKSGLAAYSFAFE